VLAVEHHDRFTRFGVGRITSWLAACVLRRVVFDAAATSDELTRDVTDVITSLYARPYGCRSASSRAAMAVAIAAGEDLR
jgi:predicted site-specific integrase-resolvase